jgi:hypothetical protein
MMVPIFKADVTAFAAELSVVTDPMWVDILNFVNQFDLTACDSDYDRRLARIFLAAHIASNDLKARSGAAGPVTSESAGGVRRSYGFVAYTQGSNLNSTRYGQAFSDILDMTGAAGPFLV